MNKLIFEGTVVEGKGSGKRYIRLDWVNQQLERKLGYAPFLGTLNIKLNKDCLLNKRELQMVKADKICPAEGYCVGLLFSGSIQGVKCAILLPQVEGYPEDRLEIVSPYCLRDTLGLKDGDIVTVTVQF